MPSRDKTPPDEMESHPSYTGTTLGISIFLLPGAGHCRLQLEIPGSKLAKSVVRVSAFRSAVENTTADAQDTRAYPSAYYTNVEMLCLGRLRKLVSQSRAACLSGNDFLEFILLVLTTEYGNVIRIYSP